MADKDTVVAHRKTFDGKTVKFWGDGAVTTGMNWYVPGGKLPKSMIFLIADEIEIYDWDELPCLVKTAKRMSKLKKYKGRSVLPGELRTEVARSCKIKK